MLSVHTVPTPKTRCQSITIRRDRNYTLKGPTSFIYFHITRENGLELNDQFELCLFVTTVKFFRLQIPRLYMQLFKNTGYHILSRSSSNEITAPSTLISHLQPVLLRTTNHLKSFDDVLNLHLSAHG